MTSSFQNVVGTPRDQVPDISNTNYLNTEADMTESVNKQIDDNIRDTKQFFDQMVELEELAASKFDKRLNAIESIIGSVGDIVKKRRAAEAEELSAASPTISSSKPEEDSVAEFENQTEATELEDQNFNTISPIAKMLMDEGLLVSKRPERAEKVKDVPPEELFSICGPCMSWVGLDHWVRMMSMRVSRMLPKSFPDKPIVKGGAALVAKST